MPKNLYITGVVIDSAIFTLDDFEDENGDTLQEELPIQLAEGSVGVIPVFTNKKNAMDYAKKIGANVHKLKGEIL